MNKNITIWILIIVIIILGYFALRPKHTIAPVIVDTTTSASTTTPATSVTTTAPVISTALPTPYISAQQNWPPVAQFSSAPYTCKIGTDSEQAKTTSKSINGRTYCITSSNDGTAGSTYTTYTYMTAARSGSGTESSTFVLRFVDCGNYDAASGGTTCSADQANFSPDAVVYSVTP